MTKLQQEVVNHLKDGWILKYGHYSSDYLISPDGYIISVTKQTTNALIKKGIIYDAGKQFYKLVENE